MLTWPIMSQSDRSWGLLTPRPVSYEKTRLIPSVISDLCCLWAAGDQTKLVGRYQEVAGHPKKSREPRLDGPVRGTCGCGPRPEGVSAVMLRGKTHSPSPQPAAGSSTTCARQQTPGSGVFPVCFTDCPSLFLLLLSAPVPVALPFWPSASSLLSLSQPLWDIV